MITTVTTTVATAASLASAPALAIVGTLLLIGMLVTKELAESSGGLLASRLARAINIGIIPMFVVFALIAMARLLDAMP